jgi:hypothetical protein
MWRGDFFAGALLASLCGFLLIGLTESLFDGPRVTTLFFLVVFAGLLRPAGGSGTVHPWRSAAKAAPTDLRGTAASAAPQ